MDNHDKDGDLPPRLVCGEKGTFAYDTIQRRHPVILTNVIDFLSRMHSRSKLVSEKEDVNFTISEIARLKYELITDKPLAPLIVSHKDEGDVYNTIIANLDEQHSSYHTVPWLLEECYLYRRIRDILLRTSSLSTFDPFAETKLNAWNNSIVCMVQLATRLKYILAARDAKQQVDPEFVLEELIQFALWGNKSDLSLLQTLSVEDAQRLQGADSGSLARIKSKIIVDDTAQLINILKSISEQCQVGNSPEISIILDNAGFELFNDLCLADWLITAKYCSRVILHTKPYFWFVSDATQADLEWTLKKLRSNGEPLSFFADRWSDYLRQGKWLVHTHPFWNLPYDYTEMPVKAAGLYKALSHTSLIIFKGDLNYRKLLGDRKWPVNSPFTTVLGKFRPSPLCALRTNKADIICGIEPATAEKISADATDWLTSGEYGVIQVAP